MKTQFHTVRYERSHGKKPSGFGCWAFLSLDAMSEDEIIFTPHGMLLSDAKKWACEALPDAFGIEIMP